MVREIGSATVNSMISIRLTLTGLFMSSLLLVTAGSAQAEPSYQSQTFASSGNWTVPANVESIDILVVGGGGGGGGGRAGGGGGGGEVEVCTNVAVNAEDNLAVTVGAGGLGGAAYTPGPTALASANGNPGNDSKVTLQAAPESPLCSGSAGLGGAADTTILPTAMSTTGGDGGASGAGKVGGVGIEYLGGGGGGAGFAGGEPDLYNFSGFGGAGLTPSTLETAGLFADDDEYYGGGGGGGANCECGASLGGIGGGGNGYGYFNSGSSGAANTGGGGGGATEYDPGDGAGAGDGGSGYVVIRYNEVAAPSNSTPPQVSGVNAKGEELSTDNGTWTGSPTGYAYKWQRCDDDQGTGCVYIESEANATYTVSASDVGKYIRSEVTAINGSGTSEPQASANYIGPIINTFALDITKSGTGTGTVIGTQAAPESVGAQNGDPINCGPTCSNTFLENTFVTLTATANYDSTFVKWSGDKGACDDTNPTCEVTMDQARTVDAQFDIGVEQVNVTKSGNGSGTVTSVTVGPGSLGAEPSIDCGPTCSADFPFYSTVTLTATADSGSIFTQWSGNCDSVNGNECVLNISPPDSCAGGVVSACAEEIEAAIAARSVDARFIQGQSGFELSVTKSGNGAGTVVGTVPVVNAAATGINCGDSCSEVFYPGAQVTLTATAAAGSTFVGFSGGGCSGTAPCVVTMISPITVNAEFTKPSESYKLTVDKSDGGSVSSDPQGIDCGTSCEANFAAASKVTLTAKAASGYKFSSWEGACAGQGASCQVTMSEAKSTKAVFAKLTAPKLEIQIDAGKNSLRAGQKLPVTINVENVGEETATNTEVCFTIPQGFSFVSATKPYTVRGRLVCWKLGDLAGSEVQTAAAKQLKVNLRALRSARSGSVNLRAAAAAENAQAGTEVTAKTKTKVKVKKAKRKPKPVTG